MQAQQYQQQQSLLWQIADSKKNVDDSTATVMTVSSNNSILSSRCSYADEDHKHKFRQQPFIIRSYTSSSLLDDDTSSCNNHNIAGNNNAFNSQPAGNQQISYAQDSLSVTNSSIEINGFERKYPTNCSLSKIVPFLEDDMKQVISESPFLLSQHRTGDVENDATNIPIFHRSEILTGSLLGQGGFSDVYEVIGFQLNHDISLQLSSHQKQLRVETVINSIDPNTGRGRFAIKQLQKRLLTENDDTRAFLLAAADLAIEVSYLSKMRHPNILAVRGLPFRGVKAFLDGQFDSYFMLCDRLDSTLDERINRIWKQTTSSSAPDIAQKTSYAFQLAKALEYLHQHRIIFRDLKPQNIGFALDQPDQIVLFDFGLVRELPSKEGDNKTALSDVYEMSGVGTRRYMAPEVVNFSMYNLKVDVYGWSMVFWEMLTHTKPYPFHSIDEHRRCVCEGEERPIIREMEWPISVQELLLRSWTSSLQSRLSMSEVCYCLEQILQEQRQEQQSFTMVNGIFKNQDNEWDDAPQSPAGIIDDDCLFVKTSGLLNLSCLPDYMDSLNFSVSSSSSSIEPPSTLWLSPNKPNSFFVNHDSNDNDKQELGCSSRINGSEGRPVGRFHEVAVESDCGIEVLLSDSSAREADE